MKILVDHPILSEALRCLLAEPGVTVDCLDSPADSARAVDSDRIVDAEALFCTFPPINLGEMRNLRWIQLASTGYTQLFGLDLYGRGIRATNARGCFDVPIAEWNVAMMINLVRDLRQMVRNQDAAVWDRSARFQRELRGLTVGLWGYGGIGRETARLARALGMRVHTLTRNGSTGPRGAVYSVPGTGDPDGTLPDRVFGSGQELEFLSELDFLVLALPLTHATNGLIGERELRALPRHAHLLNPARGQIVQEPALLRALQEGWIAGAALDTHYHYPMRPEHPLWKFPNVIFTPHISGSSLSPRFSERLWDIMIQNVRRYRRQDPLLNELTVSQLKGS